ncbi:hypothetical protein Pmani_015049 [Petrolisthes manimaculis]|uniref:Nucleolar protein 11 n=1 Tax=Petrolisthes manimaculis TaxID=1843537 RepID=A0AAE1PT06_9EUCA|nr:hypothetical protein Pmani_015049 [Petrolisthes manimaculis]
MAAVLHEASVFCVDFHLKNLLGVTEDKENNVLITCRGVVKRYHVKERRQLQCWTAKSWHLFTSAAVYNPASDKITAIIGNTSLIQWRHDTEDIEKAKKLNFETSIHQLFMSDGTLYILFSTGQVEEVSVAMKSRKEMKPGFLSAHDTIRHAEIIKGTKYLLLVVESERNVLRLYKIQMDNSSSAPVMDCPLSLDDARLTGVCVLSSGKLFTLWSTGDLYTFDLENDYADMLPGQKHAEEGSVVATKNAKMLELSPSHIVIIGLDRQDEGGIMVLRDVRFGISISVRKLKMYHNPPLAWVVSQGVVVAEGASLSWIPFTVQESNLATVFATKVFETQGSASEVCHSWVKNRNQNESQEVPPAAVKNVYCNKTSALSKVIGELDRGSLSESLLASEVIKCLIDKKSLKLLNEAVNVFTDIPESGLIDVLMYYLQCKDMNFAGIIDVPQLQLEIEPLDKDGDKIVCPFSSEKAYFINGILQKPFTDVELLKVLSKIPFDNAIMLIQYLHYLVASGEAMVASSGSQTLSLCRAGEWLGLLLDINYHQLVISSEITVHRLLLSCFDSTTIMCKFLEHLMDTGPLMQCVLKGNPLPLSSHTSKPYFLERLVLTKKGSGE